MCKRLSKLYDRLRWRMVLSNQPADHYFTFRDALEGSRFDNIAGGLQRYFEDMLSEWFEHFINLNRDCRTVVFSGGLSMNVKANMVLAERASRFGMSFFAAPSGDDYSHCVSAAYAGQMSNETCLDGIRPGTLTRLDWGRKFDADDTTRLLNWCRSKGWAVQPYDATTAAQWLMNGKVLALCHGNAEFGARALGFRSIIADPRDFDTVRKLNVAVKQRDFWMPFAPAVLEGHEASTSPM